MSASAKVIQDIHQAIRREDAESLRSTLIECRADALEAVTRELPRAGNALHVACRVGNIDCIRVILDTGVNVNIRQIEGHAVSGLSPIHVACTEGHPGVVELLLSRGADPNVQESEGQTPLHCSCISKNVEVVKSLLANGAMVNKADNRGQSPLQMSIMRAPDSISHLLIQEGADVHVIDKDGQTPLHYAAEWGKEKLVSLLLAHGAKVNQQDEEGRSALHVADPDTPRVLKVLIAGGGDVSLRDKRGKPPIEKQLDMKQEEFQAINAALSKHMEKSKVRKTSPNPATVQQVQERYNRLAMAPSSAMAGMKDALHSELLKRGGDGEGHGSPSGAKYKPSPLAAAGVLSELKGKTSPK